MDTEYDVERQAESFVLLGGQKYDRWIIGEGADSTTEYISHLSEPKFVAKIAEGQQSVPASELVINIGGVEFYDIVWIDSPPKSEQDLLQLFRAAEAAIERDSQK